MTVEKENLPYERKYRPENFDDVLGQDSVVRSLKKFLSDKKSCPHTFLFSGTPGLGKTTLARIIAWELGCTDKNVLEIDGATHTGIDAMKDVCADLDYPTVGKNPIKFVIIDEAHSLSKKAWDSMLKITEEPPEHVYFVFCTSELNKVPTALQDQRCTSYNLKSVSKKNLTDLLDYVVKEEGLETSERIVDLIVASAGGSPRKALNYLSKCRGCESTKDAAELLETIEDGATVEELFQLIVKGAKWEKVRNIVKELDVSDFSGVRIQIFTRLAAYCVNAREEKDSVYYLDCLDKLKNPYYIAQTSKGEFLLQLGDIFLN